jgi:hypothetical protein
LTLQLGDQWAAERNLDQGKSSGLSVPLFLLASIGAALEQAPKKLIDFFDKSLLQRFDFERFLSVRTIPFERKVLFFCNGPFVVNPLCSSFAGSLFCPWSAPKTAGRHLMG